MKSRLDGYDAIYKALCKINEMGPLMLLIDNKCHLIMESVKHIDEAVETLDNKTRNHNMKIIQTDIERIADAMQRMSKELNKDKGVADMKACLDKINESWKMYE